jgi:hypothetical protein
MLELLAYLRANDFKAFIVAAVGRLDKCLDEAPKRGWTVVDMKNDWKTIFPAGTK